MNRDREILKNHLALPALRFYRWASPALSYGRTQGIHASDLGEAAKKGWAVVQRPSGGGKVEHGNDLCFSIFWTKEVKSLPWKVKGSYLAIHEWIAKSLDELGIASLLTQKGMNPDSGWCFQSAVCFDLISDGSKIVGGAQWREKNAALHQGSIQLGLGEETLGVFKKTFQETFNVSF